MALLVDSLGLAENCETWGRARCERGHEGVSEKFATRCAVRYLIFAPGPSSVMISGTRDLPWTLRDLRGWPGRLCVRVAQRREA